MGSKIRRLSQESRPLPNFLSQTIHHPPWLHHWLIDKKIILLPHSVLPSEPPSIFCISMGCLTLGVLAESPLFSRSRLCPRRTCRVPFVFLQSVMCSAGSPITLVALWGALAISRRVSLASRLLASSPKNSLPFREVVGVGFPTTKKRLFFQQKFKILNSKFKIIYLFLAHVKKI